MQVSSQLMAAYGPLPRPIRVAYGSEGAVSKAAPGVAGAFEQYVKEHWKKVAVAVGSGLLAGFLAGAVTSREYLDPTRVVYAATPQVAPGNSLPGQTALDELARLRVENRQLRALVDDLQKGRPASHGRHLRPRRRSGAHE